MANVAGNDVSMRHLAAALRDGADNGQISDRLSNKLEAAMAKCRHSLDRMGGDCFIFPQHEKEYAAFAQVCEDAETLASLLAIDTIEEVKPRKLRPGDRVVVKAGEIIPGDGEIVQGIASIDESAITGESAPVICEAEGVRTCVSGGTLVVSRQIVVRITSGARTSFLDRMILLLEGARQQFNARSRKSSK